MFFGPFPRPESGPGHFGEGECPTLLHRLSRTLDCERRVGARILFKGVSNTYSCGDGWGAPGVPFPLSYEIRGVGGIKGVG